jgi:membrane protease YdiL (CAAX protease family)
VKRLNGQTESALAIAIARGCLIAPLFEELFFRGLLLGWLGKRFTTSRAIIVSAALFAAPGIVKTLAVTEQNFYLVCSPSFLQCLLAETPQHFRSLVWRRSGRKSDKCRTWCSSQEWNATATGGFSTTATPTSMWE